MIEKIILIWTFSKLIDDEKVQNLRDSLSHLCVTKSYGKYFQSCKNLQTKITKVDFPVFLLKITFLSLINTC